jgi:serine/threonine protein kinase
LLAGEAAAAAAWSDVEAGSEVTYTASIDHWSLGATLYEMATGQAPFIARSIAGTYKRIQAYDLNRGILHRHCTDPALQSLIVSLLCPASDRLDTADLRRHPFFAMTEWENIRSGTAVPPHDLAPITPRGLEDEPTLGQSQFSFSLAPRYDQTSPASNFADFTQFTQTYSDPSEWLGWTFMPDPADLRDSVPAHVSPVKLDVDDRYRTPRRQTSGTSFKPPPSTAKRVPKKTPGSNPYFDLLKCVHDSARKKRTSSQHKAPQQVTIDAVERDVTKLIGQLQVSQRRTN